MKNRPTRAPSYRQRRDYPEHAIVTLTDARTGKRRDYWLGAFGSRESKERHHRLLAAWKVSGRELPDPRDDLPTHQTRDAEAITVTEVVRRFWSHSKRTYVRDDGVSFKIALRPDSSQPRESGIGTECGTNACPLNPECWAASD